MKTITQIKTLFVNNTNQVEVYYAYTDLDEEGFKVRGTEGRVWSPTDDMAADTLSGVHPDVVKLAAAYWSTDVVKAFSADVIATQATERAKVEEATAALIAAQAELAKAQEAAKAPVDVVA